MTRIPRSVVDTKYRDILRQELAKSKRTVQIIAGRLSELEDYYDMQMALEEATKRGVKVSIYSNSYHPGIGRKLKRWGCKLYKGKCKINDHAWIMDGRKLILSRNPALLQVGEKHGEITMRGAKAYQNLFMDLVKQGRPVKRIVGPDPFDEFLSKPAWRGGPIDTSHMDGDLGQISPPIEHWRTAKRHPRPG